MIMITISISEPELLNILLVIKKVFVYMHIYVNLQFIKVLLLQSLLY